MSRSSPPAYPQGDRPYLARPLSLPEIRAGDVHSYASPKEGGRLVRVLGLARIAQAMLLEAAPHIVAYTERPRVLEVGNARYEICFWCREKTGEERMLMVVLGSSKPAPGGKRRAHRQAEALIDAARAAHLPLEFVHEADLLAQSDRIALAYRLLPDVQTALRLSNRGVLQDAILDQLSRHHRLRFSQLLTALEGYQPADVQGVLAYLVHGGTLACDATDRWLRSTTFEVVP